MPLTGFAPYGPFRRYSRILRRHLPRMNFITVHYMYFAVVILITSVVFWGSSTPAKSVSYTDSLFLVTSAMTLAGLNTINLSTLNTFQQVLLFLLIIIGSAIFVSAFVVHVRRRAFEAAFTTVIDRERQRRAALRKLSKSNRSLSRQRGLTYRSESQSHVASAIGDGDNVSEKEKADQSVPRGVDSFDERNQIAGHSQDLGNRLATPVTVTAHDEEDENHISFSPETVFRSTSHDVERGRASHRRHGLSMQGVGARSSASLHTAVSRDSHNTLSPTSEGIPISQDLSTHSGMVGRNSQFHGLTDSDRERIGGVEYRAIRFLAILVPLYFVLWQLLGCIGLGAYVAYNRPSVPEQNGLNPWWVGVFNGVSAFNNSGMSLLDANMVAFQTSAYMLLTMGVMILAGNTCYPVFLRLIIWTILKFLPKTERWKEDRSTLEFLLLHPRRCYTNLFPSRHTWWLLGSVVCLNGIDWIGFEILNIGNEAITDVPGGFEVLDGLFQALAVRSGGFYVVPIPTVRVSLQVLYVVMMYISVYPVVITMRNSNVYEERSLGIYSDDPGYSAGIREVPDDETDQRTLFSRVKRNLTKTIGAAAAELGLGDFGTSGATSVRAETRTHFVQQQFRAQLAHDIWWIVLAVFLIMIIEGPQFDRDPATFSVFNVIFEIVSGYGCVGISTGVPDDAYSFCGSWHTLSKLVLCLVMIRGRHRGLPVAIDKAVLLPGDERMGHVEEEDARIRAERSIARGNIV